MARAVVWATFQAMSPKRSARSMTAWRARIGDLQTARQRASTEHRGITARIIAKRVRSAAGGAAVETAST
eukprot:7060146-Alexandrium_andersonii.AAC.1